VPFWQKINSQSIERMAQFIEPYILYEDSHLLILDKPPGMPSQDDITQDLSVLGWGKNYIKEKYKKKGNVYLALLHRLDRPVAGVLLLAKTSKAAARLSKQFQEGTVKKEYIAVTEKVPVAKDGILVHYLKKVSGKNIVRAYQKHVAHSQEAKLYYEVMRTLENKAILKVLPYTGRQHQIRVQLANIGCPICGDVKYGKTNFLPDLSILLLSHRIQFMHPISGELMQVKSELGYKDLVRKLK
jgi:23S rRNA pseudouridine1911/1915/1917 synthase